MTSNHIRLNIRTITATWKEENITPFVASIERKLGRKSQIELIFKGVSKLTKQYLYNENYNNMTNWKKLKITNIKYNDNPPSTTFYLNDYVNYNDGEEYHIHCTFTNYFMCWDEDDGVEIDIEATSNYSSSKTFSFFDNVMIRTWVAKSRDLKNVKEENSRLKEQISKLEEEVNIQLVLRRNTETEKSRVETERNEWRTKFNDKNSDYEDYKEKYDEVQAELSRLKNERISENRKHNNEILNKERENSTLRIEKTREEEQKNAANNQVIDLSRRLENKEEEVSLVRREKENQEITLLTKIDQKQQLLENVRQSLEDLKIKHEREKGEKTAEVKEKDSELKEKEKELKRKEEELKNSQKKAGQSREELLSERVQLKYGKLEIFANQIGINLQQVSDLCRYCERLIRARKNSNQANIETHEDNITRVREGLRQGGVQIENIQKFCNKCGKIAKMRAELNEVRQQQQQYEARQETPPLNNNRNNRIG